MQRELPLNEQTDWWRDILHCERTRRVVAGITMYSFYVCRKLSRIGINGETPQMGPSGEILRREMWIFGRAWKRDTRVGRHFWIGHLGIWGFWYSLSVWWWWWWRVKSWGFLSRFSLLSWICIKLFRVSESRIGNVSESQNLWLSIRVC